MDDNSVQLWWPVCFGEHVQNCKEKPHSIQYQPIISRQTHLTKSRTALHNDMVQWSRALGIQWCKPEPTICTLCAPKHTKDTVDEEQSHQSVMFVRSRATTHIPIMKTFQIPWYPQKIWFSYKLWFSLVPPLPNSRYHMSFTNSWISWWSPTLDYSG